MTDFTERLQTAVVDRYRIERHLGEGGMATVYLAHDLKHDRPVALKVLRPELAAVIGAERFLAEIRTTANLQHPNILPLFDSGDADGQLFYVMPYVEGESLRERITREKQLPIEDAVRIGVEVAGALDYAHRQGVVHRDIKPENILLHDGRALVADFGIALALSTAGGSRMTETGMSVGTPAYMSPEQAMGGHEVTGRSDVYALGATLYETLVGEPPFTGPTAQAIIARLVTEDPRPLVSQRKTVPAHVEGAVLMALERLPADRFATAAELGEALEGRLKLPARASGADAPSQRSGVRRYRRLLAALSAATLLLAGTALWGWLRPIQSRPLRRQVVSFGSVHAAGDVAFVTAVAPDGSAIVYGDRARSTGNLALWIKERDELDPRMLVQPPGGGTPPGPAFSPDGRWIVYTDGKLEKIARAGGAPVALSDSAAAFGAAWLDDGTIAFIGDGGRTLLRTTQGGPTTRVLVADSTERFMRIAPVPGAEAALVGVGSLSGQPREIGVDLKSGDVHELARGAIGAWVVPGDMIVYGEANGSLLAAPFDRRALALKGPPVSILDGVGVLDAVKAIGATLGADGTLLYGEGTAGDSGDSHLVSVQKDGSATVLDTAWSRRIDGNSGVDLSPDGGRLALSVLRPGRRAGSDIYVVRLPEGPALRLTFDGTRNIRPRWSPDGKTILYASDAGGKMELWTRHADGSGKPVRVVTAKREVMEGLWSPDGSWIVYRTDDLNIASGDILAVRTHGDTTPVSLVATDSADEAAALSPDGHWLAYVSNIGGRNEVYVCPFPDTHDGGPWQVSTDGGTEPQWSHDGTTLFYRNGAERMVEVDVTEKPTFAPGKHTVLFDAGFYLQNRYYHFYALTPDDKRFLMVRRPGAGQEWAGRWVLVENWMPELRAKLKGRGHS